MQFASLGGVETLSADVGGADLVATSNFSPFNPFIFVVTPEIKTADDLRGKKVAISAFGGSADLATRVGLQREGLDPTKDVELVATGSASNMTGALLNGAVQGGLSWPPDSLKLEAQGIHVLFDLAAQKLPANVSLIVSQRSFITDRRSDLQRFTDAVIQAIGRSRQDKSAALQVLAKYLQVDDPDALQATYDFFVGEVIPTQPFPRPADFADAMGFVSSQNPAAAGFDLSKMLDPSFVQSSVDRGLA